MKKKFLLSAASLAFCLGAVAFSGGPAHAQWMGSLPYYGVTKAEIRDHYYEWQLFLDSHEDREPCEHYQAPPAGWVLNGCTLQRIGSIEPAAGGEALETIVPRAGSPANFYTLYFDFNKSNIRASEKERLNNAVHEIEKYNPSEVTVSGYADRSGTTGYNQLLSERRAKSVARALVAKGINANVINQKAYGEGNLAIQTADGVRKQENRRIVIDLEKPQ